MVESDADSTHRPGHEETTADCEAGPADDQWMRAVWSTGSYSEIAPKYAAMAGHLVERSDVQPEEAVLDIGCGTGTVAITAAREGGTVTGVDITPSMLNHARGRAVAAGVEDIAWREADATDLPFADDTFDVTLSNLGHMYGDPPAAAARELLRVTRPGGRIAFTSWTPTSVYPSMAGVAMTVLPPEALPDFSEPPFLWGDADTVRTRLGESVDALAFDTASIQYPALSPTDFWHHTTSNSGMFIEVLRHVDDADLEQLREQLIETIEPAFDPRENAVELTYLLTTATVDGDS